MLEIKKIKLTQEQLDNLNNLVVTYMIAAENASGDSDEDKRALLLVLDKVWDDLFEVCCD